MFKTIEILAEDDDYLRCRHTKPEKDEMVGLDHLLIIMLHGFPGNKDGQSDVFNDLSFLLKDKGFHCLSVDLRGCGESDGRQEDFTIEHARTDLKVILEWAKDQGYKKFMFVGEGLGATIPLMDPAEEVLTYVMLWPVLDFSYTAKTVFKADEIKDEWKKAGYILREKDRIGLDFLKELCEIDVEEMLSHVTRPLLVMHGAADKVSPIDRLDYLRGYVNSKRVEITTFQDGTHGLPALNHRKAMHFHILQFIEKYASFV